MNAWFIIKKPPGFFTFLSLSIIILGTITLIKVILFPSGLYGTLSGHSDSICCVTFSPDGNYIATGSKDQTGRIWNFATRREWAILWGHTGSVLCVAFSPDSKLLVSGSGGGSLKVWEVSTGSEIAILSGHEQVPVAAVAFSHNGRVLASGGYDKVIRIWDMPTRSEIAVLKGHASAVSSLAFSSEDRLLASRSIDGSIYIWDTRDWSRRKQLGSAHLILDSFFCLSFGPVTNTLASNESNHSIKLWDITKDPGNLMLEADVDWPVCSMAFSPDGKLLAGLTVLGFRNLLIWDATTGHLLCKRHVIPATSIAFSPDGKYLATGGVSSALKLWEVSSLLH